MYGEPGTMIAINIALTDLSLVHDFYDIDNHNQKEKKVEEKKKK